MPTGTEAKDANALRVDLPRRCMMAHHPQCTLRIIKRSWMPRWRNAVIAHKSMQSE